MVDSDRLLAAERPVMAEANGTRVVLLDTIMVAGEQERGDVVISGSHGGASAGDHASRQPIAAAFFNDAGFGREDAGVAGLESLQRAGIPGGAVRHTTARIGEAQETWSCGVISRLNQAALDAGFVEGEPLETAVLRFIEQRPA